MKSNSGSGDSPNPGAEENPFSGTVMVIAAEEWERVYPDLRRQRYWVGDIAQRSALMMYCTNFEQAECFRRSVPAHSEKKFEATQLRLAKSVEKLAKILGLTAEDRRRLIRDSE